MSWRTFAGSIFGMLLLLTLFGWGRYQRYLSDLEYEEWQQSMKTEYGESHYSPGYDDYGPASDYGPSSDYGREEYGDEKYVSPADDYRDAYREESPADFPGEYGDYKDAAPPAEEPFDAFPESP